jgi:hypothetical protein
VASPIHPQTKPVCARWNTQQDFFPTAGRQRLANGGRLASRSSVHHQHRRCETLLVRDHRTPRGSTGISSPSSHLRQPHNRAAGGDRLLPSYISCDAIWDRLRRFEVYPAGPPLVAHHFVWEMRTYRRGSIQRTPRLMQLQALSDFARINVTA